MIKTKFKKEGRIGLDYKKSGIYSLKNSKIKPLPFILFIFIEI